MLVTLTQGKKKENGGDFTIYQRRQLPGPQRAADYYNNYYNTKMCYCLNNFTPR